MTTEAEEKNKKIISISREIVDLVESSSDGDSSIAMRSLCAAMGLIVCGIIKSSRSRESAMRILEHISYTHSELSMVCEVLCMGKKEEQRFGSRLFYD